MQDKTNTAPVDKPLNQLFYELVRVSIGTQDSLTRVPAEQEWFDLYQMSKKQSMIGVCFAGVLKIRNEQTSYAVNLPKPLYLKWVGMTAKIKKKNALMNQRTDEVLAHFRSLDIPCTILKGQGIAQLYGPLSEVRHAGDIDVWLSCTRQQLYKNSIDTFGRLEGVTYHHIHYPLFPDVEVEAHVWPSMLPNPWHNKRLQKFSLLHAPTAGCPDIPSLPFLRVYIPVHIYTHFCGHGVGFRHLLDFYYVMTQGVTETEKQDAMRWAESLGMRRFMSALMWVSVHVLGMNPELCLCEPSEEDGLFLLSEVMQTGNMGHMDERIDRKQLSTPVGRYLFNVRHGIKLISICPHYTFWQPLWNIYQYFYCKYLVLRYKG